MTRWRRTGALVLAAALFTTTMVTEPAAAQLANMERSPGHERLDFLVGEWFHAEPRTILGEETVVRSNLHFRWLPGGVWLRGEATIWGLPGLEEHHGWYQLTWDEVAGEYVQLWSDNQSTVLFTKRGGWTDENTLVLEGTHVWRGQTVYSKDIYRITSPDEFSREYRVSYDVPESLSQRSLSVFRRETELGETNEAFASLAWLVGDWRGTFQIGDGSSQSPTTTFDWGDPLRSSLRVVGTRPTPDGRLVPEFESMVVWHPKRQKHVFLSVYRSGAGRVTEDGDVDLLEDGAVRFNMRVHYPPGAELPFGAGTAGAEGETLEFRRTFHREGPDRLRDVFRMRRGDTWEDPQSEHQPDDGYPWRRVGGTPAPSP